MKLIKLSIAGILALSIAFTSCKPKDADVQAAVQQKEATGITVSVKEGVVTLEGTVADDASKAKAEEIAKAEKGVNSVVNNLVLPPPPPPAAMGQTPAAADEPMMAGVRDAVKDHPTVSASVANGVVTLTGSIAKAKLPKLMMAISALKPAKIDNQLKVN